MKKKKDKIYNVSIYKRLVLMSLHVLLQTIPASVVCAREGGEKGIMAHENARETWCSTWTDDSWAKLKNFVVQKRDRC